MHPTPSAKLLDCQTRRRDAAAAVLLRHADALQAIDIPHAAAALGCLRLWVKKKVGHVTFVFKEFETQKSICLSFLYQISKVVCKLE